MIGDGKGDDQADAESLYQILESEIVPLYYESEGTGIPRGWMRMVKEAMRSIVPVFCARRMLKEYTERTYRAATLPPVGV